MRLRQHVNPLEVSFERLDVDSPALRAGRPVEVEVGCAEAQFLFERAAADPERDYVGIEIREALVEWVNARAREESAPVQAIFGHANHHLGRILPAGAVSRAYVNFPDPWFKRKHHKRRMVDDGLAGALIRALAPGGELFVQTDVWAIALDALDAFERREESLENAAGAWAFWKAGNPYGARSAREDDCRARGRAIWRLLYRRRPAGAAPSTRLGAR